MKKSFYVLGILALLVLAACTSQNPNRPEEKRYFQGYDGIDMEWADADSPPRRLYYYSDTEDNSFDVSVQVSNEGSSFSKGGVYLSGYDPNLIKVDGINPDLTGFGDCSLSLGSIGFDGFGVEVQCGQNRVSAGKVQGCTEINANLRELPFWEEAGFDLSTTCEDSRLTVNLGDKFSFDVGSRGRLMAAIFSGIDFTKHFGTEYLLAGDTPDFPGGDIAIIDWDANIENWPSGLDQTRQTFLVTNCYLYTTHAAPVVCIDPAPFSQTEKVCRPTLYNPTNGQGAPVAVTNIKQENTPRQAIFTITVANTGGGKVWDPTRMEKCSPYHDGRVSSSDLNKVWLGQIRVSGDPARLDCTPEDFIRLDKDTQRGMVTCRYNLPVDGLKSAYETPLVVELWYGYEETIRKTVTVKRAI